MLTYQGSCVNTLQVKRDYSGLSFDDEPKEPVNKKIRSGKKIAVDAVAPHLNCNVKGQHIGEMLAVSQESSFFGQKGLFGIIVLGTKVQKHVFFSIFNFSVSFADVDAITNNIYMF